MIDDHGVSGVGSECSPVVSWLFFWWFGKFHTSCKASQHPCPLISTRSNDGGILSFSWVLNAQVFHECSQGLFLESTSFHMSLPGLVQVIVPHFLIGLSTHEVGEVPGVTQDFFIHLAILVARLYGLYEVIFFELSSKLLFWK